MCKINKKLIKNRACSHSLCLICWETWLQTRLSCPICR
ncbi:MAG: hypothetical protein JST59_02930 [Actinobacteria bacterium]|nr:hypothetical protein [Actinomycetota bacterium]